jgi:hypothetical protein
MRIAYRMCMIISHTENCVKIPWSTIFDVAPPPEVTS